MNTTENDLIVIYLTIDLAILNISIFLTAWLSLILFSVDIPNLSPYLLNANLSWILTYMIFAKRNLFLRDGYINRVWRISKRTVIFLIISSVLIVLTKADHFSRSFLIYITLLFYVGKLIFYRILYSYMKYKRRNNLNTQKVLIVGINETTKFLKRLIESNPMLGYQFIGFASAKNLSDEKIIGHKNDLEKLIKEHNINMVFVSLSIFAEKNNSKNYLRICNQLGVRLRFVPENQRWLKSRVNMETLGGLVIFNPQQVPLDDVTARVTKRLFDIFFSLGVIVLVFSWLFPILFVLIKLDSRGPIFFVQKRTGINNKTFNCLKFRSMKVNGSSDIKQATPDDDRITKIGKFIRKSNIDELPQFFNVLWGQMSVVGPRPHMLKHTEMYSELIEHYMVRHYVKPGITGWAQIKGLRGNTDELWKMEHRVKHDMEYIENWTMWWDIQIIFQTTFKKEAFANAG